MLGIVTLANYEVLSLAISPPNNNTILEGLGELPGEYMITTHESVKPKVRPSFKEKFDELVQRNVITPVTEPTEWVSSMLVVIEPNKIRNFFTPKPLKESTIRLPTMEEMAYSS